MERITARVGIVVACLCLGCGGTDSPELKSSQRPDRTLDPSQMLLAMQARSQPLRLRTTGDTLPGGLSAAMAPMFIDWKKSTLDAADASVVVHNLNYGGNPIEGTTVLQSARIPLDGVEHVEWILVPLGFGGSKATTHHAQLRFVFKAEQPVTLINLADDEEAGDPTLQDLIVSWEAWRGPTEGYDIREGLDPKAYRLSMRLYAGPQRFLEDALGHRDWFCTVLRLPGGEKGLKELLLVALTLGDGVARHTISEEFAELSASWLAGAPSAERASLEREWESLRELAQPRQKTGDERLDLPPELRSYHSALRSCASMAYYSVLVATERLMERGFDDGVHIEELDQPHLGGEEPWMLEMSDASAGGMLLKSPLALSWLRSHPFAIPREIPGRLDRAGLVRRIEGERVEAHYSATELTPYGLPDEHLIR